MLKKPAVSSKVVLGGKGFPVDDGAEALFPCLWAFLTATTWPEDGKSREPGSILLFTQEGALKIMLKDRDQGLVAFWTGASLQGLLEAVERDLDAGAGDWRRDRPAPAGRKPAR